jgi:hypothetical protein
MARERSEATMRFNHFDSMILGFNSNAQGSVIAVEATHRTTLRSLIIKIARRLSLRGSWQSLLGSPAGASATFSGWMPVAATCPSYSDTRFQRHERWMSGVVVDPGTVGVC